MAIGEYRCCDPYCAMHNTSRGSTSYYINTTAAPEKSRTEELLEEILCVLVELRDRPTLAAVNNYAPVTEPTEHGLGAALLREVAREFGPVLIEGNDRECAKGACCE